MRKRGGGRREGKKRASLPLDREKNGADRREGGENLGIEKRDDPPPSFIKKEVCGSSKRTGRRGTLTIHGNESHHRKGAGGVRATVVERT